MNVKVLSDFQPANTVRNLAVRSRSLDSRTEVGVEEGNAVSIAAAGIDDLTGRNGTVGVNPNTLPPTVSRGGISDLVAVAISLSW